MNDTDTKGYRFSWHHENDQNWESFWSWIVVHLMTQNRNGSKRDQEVMDATDGGKTCHVQVFLNGIEFDAKEIFDRIMNNAEYMAKLEAERILQEVAGLESMRDFLDDAERNLLAQFRNQFSHLGFEWRECR